jgi:hypothetical protein
LFPVQTNLLAHVNKMFSLCFVRNVRLSRSI